MTESQTDRINRASAFYGIKWGSFTAGLVTLVGRFSGDAPANSPNTYYCIACFVLAFIASHMLDRYEVKYPGLVGSRGSTVAILLPIVALMLSFEEMGSPWIYAPVTLFVTASIALYFSVIDANREIREREQAPDAASPAIVPEPYQP